MKCAVHSDVDAVGYCRNCGKAMCSACVRPVRDVLYCEDCLASIMGIPGPPAAAAAASGQPPDQAYQAPAATAAPVYPRSSPALAFLLGFLPGMGAFYNEQYAKGMILLAIFLVLFIIGVDGSLNGGAEAAIWICIGILYFYMPIDAMRTARARLTGQTVTDPLDAFTKGRPIGPVVLIGAGILLLLHNFDWFPWWRISQFFWPAVLIGIGVFMMRGRLDRRP